MVYYVSIQFVDKPRILNHVFCYFWVLINVTHHPAHNLFGSRYHHRVFQMFANIFTSEIVVKSTLSSSSTKLLSDSRTKLLCNKYVHHMLWKSFLCEKGQPDYYYNETDTFNFVFFSANLQATPAPSEPCGSSATPYRPLLFLIVSLVLVTCFKI